LGICPLFWDFSPLYVVDFLCEDSSLWDSSLCIQDNLWEEIWTSFWTWRTLFCCIYHHQRRKWTRMLLRNNQGTQDNSQVWLLVGSQVQVLGNLQVLGSLLKLVLGNQVLERGIHLELQVVGSHPLVLGNLRVQLRGSLLELEVGSRLVLLGVDNLQGLVKGRVGNHWVLGVDLQGNFLGPAFLVEDLHGILEDLRLLLVDHQSLL